MRYSIIIPCYNRPVSLRALLDSLTNSNPIGLSVDLFISLDGRNNEIEEIVQQFTWQHGEKYFIVQKEHLGLKNHILACLELGRNNEFNIFIEDDLWVSPHLWHYLKNLEDVFKEGDFHSMSLYKQSFFPSNAQFRFHIGNQFEAMQYPCSWGFVISGKSITQFLDWLEVQKNLQVPSFINRWRNSWLKLYAAFLIESNQYVLYPPSSLITNSGAAGENHSRDSTFFQTSLMLDSEGIHFDVSKINHFDSYLNLVRDDIVKYAPNLNSYDFDVDFTGDKPLNEIKRPYLLSSRRCFRPINTWSNDLRPIERNVQFNKRGTGLNFGKTTDFEFRRKSNANEYLNSIVPPRSKKMLIMYLIHLFKKEVLSNDNIKKNH